MTSEGKIKAKVTALLKSFGHKVTHEMPVPSGWGKPGLDYIVCCAGYFVAIETKVPGKKLTVRQERYANRVKGAGGVVLVVKDDDDLERLHQTLNALIRWSVICSGTNGLAGGVTMIDGISLPSTMAP